jgi:streptomycin 6-kinase
VDRLAMPRNLLDAAAQEGRQDWLATVPGTVRQLRGLWSLDVGEPFQPGGMTAWVAPVRDASGDPLVLKIGWRHPEAEHEARALRAWAGHGAVRLVAAQESDDTVAMLLERCAPGTPLSGRPEPEQDAVIAGLLHRLWIEPSAEPGFRPLELMCAQWADRFDRQIAAGRLGLDHGLARAGLALFRELPATADRDVLLCTDLHAGNVLAARREPWLAIDPKPYVGDPAYDPLQHMLNCDERLRADPRGLATKLADLLSLDSDRLLLWLFARCALESPQWPPLADVARQIAP